MFERFSSGYYLGRLYVEPRDGDGAAIASEQHQQVNEQLYTGDGLERTDLPVVMKLGTTHFTVTGADDVPADTLVVPEPIVEATDVRNPPSLREVFLAKADRAKQLLSVAEGMPSVDTDSEAGRDEVNGRGNSGGRDGPGDGPGNGDGTSGDGGRDDGRDDGLGWSGGPTGI